MDLQDLKVFNQNLVWGLKSAGSEAEEPQKDVSNISQPFLLQRRRAESRVELGNLLQTQTLISFRPHPSADLSSEPAEAGGKQPRKTVEAGEKQPRLKINVCPDLSERGKCCFLLNSSSKISCFLSAATEK